MRRMIYAFLAVIIVLTCVGCDKESQSNDVKSDEFVGICVNQRTINEIYNGEPHEVSGETIILTSEDDTIGFEASSAFDEVQGSYSVFDETEECSCTAKLYFWKDDVERVLSIENIYRREDGSLYATGGESFSGSLDGYTYIMSQDNPNKEAKIDRLSFDITFNSAETIKSAELLEYSIKDELLRRTPLDLSKCEDIFFEVGADTDYAMVLQYMVNGNTQRTVVNKPYDGETLGCRLLAPRDDGYCVPVWIILSKNEA